MYKEFSLLSDNADGNFLIQNRHCPRIEDIYNCDRSRVRIHFTFTCLFAPLQVVEHALEPVARRITGFLDFIEKYV